MAVHKKYKHYFFDVDMTLTASKSLISGEMKQRLHELATEKDVTLVSGATMNQMMSQVTDSFQKFVTWLSQNGNLAIDDDGAELWKNELTDAEKEEINAHIGQIRNRFGVLLVGTKESDLIQDRGCQVSFSLLGHNADGRKKEMFDPGGLRRQFILEEIPLVSDNVEVKIGGTTCLDYIRKGTNKGANVKRLIERNGWNPDDCIYVGDALFPGGNDESVKGVCATLQVNDRAETLSFINTQL